MIKVNSKSFGEYHRRVVDDIAKKAPMHFIRYEDLRTKPEETLDGIFCFLLGVPSIEGLNIQRRIREVVGLGHDATVSYAQKVPTEKDLAKQKNPIIFNRNIDQYSEEQKLFVATELKDLMQIFGYCSKAEKDTVEVTEEWLNQQQTDYNFAKYAEIDDAKYNLFRKMNEQALAEVLKAKADGQQGSKFYSVNLDLDNYVKDWSHRPHVAHLITLKETKKW